MITDADGKQKLNLEGKLADKPAERLATWEEAAREDAARFWSRSAVQIADPLIEGL
jgi:hypothetical protein